MTKFDTIHNDKTNSTLDRKNAGSGGFYVTGIISGILILSLIAFAPEVDAAAGCCSIGTWDPSGFLNSEPGTFNRDRVY